MARQRRMGLADERRAHDDRQGDQSRHPSDATVVEEQGVSPRRSRSPDRGPGGGPIGLLHGPTVLAPCPVLSLQRLAP